MQPIRRIIEDAPDSIPVPSDLRHRRIEMILWPLDEAPPAIDEASGEYERTLVDKIVIPSREERNARR